MGIRAKFKGWFGKRPEPQPEVETQPVEAQVDARFDGATYFPGDPVIPGTWSDAEFDGNPGVRIKMAADARHWEESSSLINRMADLFEEFTVGVNGLRLIPNPDIGDDDSPNEAAIDWKRRGKKYWNKWCEHPELDSDRCASEVQTLMARNWFISGEIFVNKTFDRVLGKRVPRIQLIESHRVCTPANMTGPGLPDGNRISDGVELDSEGRRVAYWVRRPGPFSSSPYGNTLSLFPVLYSSGSQEWDRVAAEDMLHLYEAGRPQYQRGLTFLFPVLKDQNDLQLLQKLEVDTAKALSELALVYVTKTGEMPKANGASAARRAKTVNTVDAAGSAVTEPAPTFHRPVNQGGKKVALQTGEDVKGIDIERPSLAQQWLFDYLIWKVCAGAGFSRLIVAPYAPVQGTVVRSDLDVQSRFFLSRSSVIQKLWVEIYRWVMGWGKDFERELRGAPEDWDSVKVRPPKSINVDLGRNSDSAINEIDKGLRTRADWYAESGLDYEEEMEQVAKELAWAEKLAKKYKVSADRIMGATKPSPMATPKPEPAPANSKTNGHSNGHVNGHNRLQLYA